MMNLVSYIHEQKKVGGGDEGLITTATLHHDEHPHSSESFMNFEHILSKPEELPLNIFNQSNHFITAEFEDFKLHDRFDLHNYSQTRNFLNNDE